MSVLTEYFAKILEKVEADPEIITNQGKDEAGFYKPVRTILLRHLQMLKDLNEKPLAKPMLITAWEYVKENLPPEYLTLTPEQKAALKKMLESKAP